MRPERPQLKNGARASVYTRRTYTPAIITGLRPGAWTGDLQCTLVDPRTKAPIFTGLTRFTCYITKTAIVFIEVGHRGTRVL